MCHQARGERDPGQGSPRTHDLVLQRREGRSKESSNHSHLGQQPCWTLLDTILTGLCTDMMNTATVFRALTMVLPKALSVTLFSFNARESAGIYR